MGNTHHIPKVAAKRAANNKTKKRRGDEVSTRGVVDAPVHGQSAKGQVCDDEFHPIRNDKQKPERGRRGAEGWTLHAIH
jgi:hypothetical protein